MFQKGKKKEGKEKKKIQSWRVESVCLFKKNGKEKGKSEKEKNPRNPRIVGRAGSV